MKKQWNYQTIYFWVQQIPLGKVATYGQIAQFVECTPRMVGTALSQIPNEEELPWQRVINAQGKISLRGKQYVKQKKKLQAEGIIFDRLDRIHLPTFQWEGPYIE